MKALLKISLLLSLSALLFVSCNWDDTYSLNKFYISWAEAEGDNNRYNLILDDGTVLHIVANHVVLPDDYDIDGKRVLINYTLLDKASNTDVETYFIRLNAMEEILCKTPVYSSQIDDDQIGNDPIIVNKVWFGSKYLNILFTIYRKDPQLKHYLNLVVNEDHPDADENNVYVEFRHNAYDDPTVHDVKGRVSFDIEELIPDGKDRINLHLTYVDYDGNTVEDSGVFGRGTTAASQESYSVGQTANIR